LTDAGLKELAGVRNLRSLLLGGTEVTDRGVAALEEALPNCKAFR
jgi:internalin A